MERDVARKVYLDGAEDAYNYLSDWLDAYYEDGNAWKDFQERMEIQYQQYLAENRMIRDKNLD